MISSLKNRVWSSTFSLRKKPSKPFVLVIISDGASAAAHDVKGRGGFIILRRLGNIVHPIQWSARRLRHVSRSSDTDEILDAADALSSGM